ncbi:MAG: hypothetical protein J6J11_01850 [Treponema sp.]|nr:hypothetical protein [Treponema sp.]
MKHLILTATAGEGHNSIAYAVKAYIKEFYPEDEVEVMDIYKPEHPIFAWIINDLHFFLLKVFPRLNRLSYKMYYEAKPSPYKNMSIECGKLAKKKVLKYLEENKVDSIFCVHTYSSGLISHFIQKDLIDKNIKLVTTIPDFSIHADGELNKIFDYVITIDEGIHDFLVNKKGLIRENLYPLGLPVHPKYNLELDKEEIYQEMNITPNKFGVLIQTGGVGTGNNLTILKHLLKCKNFENINLYIANGTRKKTKEKIDSFIKKHNLKNVYNYGFTMDVHKLMEISDVMIGKLGALSVSEALLKETPIIVPKKPPYHEYWNMLYLLERNVIVHANTYQDLVPIIDDLFNNEEKINELKLNMSKMKKPEATKQIVELLRKKDKH